MRLYIIGVCGTFMGGVARLACDLGIQVSGSDANTYPPMSTQLQSMGIELFEGYHADNVDLEADIILIGNTISRGNPELELVLERGLPYTSGPQWLADNVLHERWVLGVAGTHGKTTTSSILAWILEDNQLAPGFLIGGVPENFGESARLGTTPFFVIEADEYDTAFSDKRSKFIHYRPRTLILNNLEFDHADIFADLAAIQTQFHHLIKTIPEQGLVIHNSQSPALQEVLQQGVWSKTSDFGLNDIKANQSDQYVHGDWRVEKTSRDASTFDIIKNQQRVSVEWSLIGDHNMLNALAAVAAAHHVGIGLQYATQSLSTFKSVKRRLEKLYDSQGIRVFDDFAHHPTAIAETLNALRNQVGRETIIAVLEPRSNTMKRGVHKHLLADALQSANKILIFADDNVLWDINELAGDQIDSFSTTDTLLKQLVQLITKTDDSATVNPENATIANTNIIFMSNGSFEKLPQRLIDKLERLNTTKS